jgi:hypothetical protein
MSERKDRPPRHYPPLFEKMVPIALVTLSVVVLAMLLMILSVMFGLFPGSG